MRLTPRSVKGQLIALTLIGLMVSQIASFSVILNDRRSALTIAWIHHIVTRMATVAEMIDATPADFHNKVLDAVKGGNIHFAIGAQPFPPNPHAKDDGLLLAELHKVMGEKADRAILTIQTPMNGETRFELLFGDMWRDLKKHLFPKTRFIKPPGRPVYAHISLPLKDGQWLNVSIQPRWFGASASPLLAQLATMAIISALGIIAIINRVTRPLKLLAKAASALGRGERGARLTEDGPREIVETVRAFNDMQDRLGRFVHDRTKMLAAIGHDLRTPITSLRLRAEFIEDEEIRAKIIETLDEMLQMAEATLSFAREEAAQEETRLVDLGALVSSACADLADAGHDVVCQDISGVTMRCRPVGIKRALRNVIENAVAYGKRARVSMVCSAGEISILVEDEGPGIPDEEIEKVFKPFVRLENSRNRTTGGVGLGLAIARSIARSHGGDIALRNRAGGGLRVIISLPATAPADAARPSPAQDAKAA